MTPSTSIPLEPIIMRASIDGSHETTIRPQPGSATPIASFGPNNRYELRAATSEADRLACWHLVYREYLLHGYTQPHEQEYRYSLHDALPDTATFLVETEGKVVGTVTVFPDSPLGLPADEIYRDELDALRRTGRMPVEIGRLTIAREYANDRSILMNLFDALSLYARCVRESTDLIITVNPGHARFYERMILFERAGTERNLGSVCQAPAVLLRLRLELEIRARRYAHREGPMPDEMAGSRTAYANLSGSREEARRVDIMRKLRPRPSMEFVRKHFVQDRALMPGQPSPIADLFESAYPGLLSDAYPELIPPLGFQC